MSLYEERRKREEASRRRHEHRLNAGLANAYQGGSYLGGVMGMALFQYIIMPIMIIVAIVVISDIWVAARGLDNEQQTSTIERSKVDSEVGIY